MSNPAVSKKGPGILGNPFIRTAMLSHMMLQIGIWVRNFAVLLYVTERTDQDPVAVSLISVAEFAPIFIFSFIGGTFADRWRPKRTMVGCDLLSALSVCAVLLTLAFEVWEAVYFATFVSAVLSQFSQPSMMKLFKRQVPPEQQQGAMAMTQTLTGVFMVLGPALGGAIYGAFGIETSLGFTGAAFLASALILLRLPKDEAPVSRGGERRRFVAELGDGFRYVLRSKVLRTLSITFAFVGLSSGIANTLGIFVVTDLLGKPESFMQYFQMANGAAVLAGGISVALLAKKMSPPQMLLLALAFDTAALIGMGYSTSTALTLGLNAIAGFFFPVIQVAISTMMLRWTEGAFMGRVGGVMMPMFTGTMVLMMAVSGPLLHVFSLGTMAIISGAFMLAGGMMQFAIMKERAPSFARQEPQPPASSAV
ncbi:MFS transporter [Paenibacillus xanthanilyticus]|uniref:MFS transporter n=1 Tax=Paenibacillus xanthanilyticus TaxID=1783531 RepID=A0ABV8K8L3_9BACL